MIGKCFLFVIPAHKGADKTGVSNYPLISLLPMMSKGLEEIVSTQLSGHLESNNLLPEYQFGLRRTFPLKMP